MGKVEGTVRATVRWPSGLTQIFEHLPVNQRIEIQEGSDNFLAKPFAASASFLCACRRCRKAGTFAIVGRDLADRAFERAGLFVA